MNTASSAVTAPALAGFAAEAGPPPRALLFDLGRVVIRLDNARMLASWAAAAGLPAEVVAGRYAPCDRFEAHERGEIDAPAYFDALRGRLGLAIDDEAFARGWAAQLDEVEPVVVDAIARLRGRLPIYAFTNTNRLHRRAMDARYADTLALFDHVFDSSLIGQRKPDPAAFRTVVQGIGLPAGDILFFDDLAANVAGARAAGLRAVQVRSPQDVLSTLAPLLSAPPR